MAKMKLPSQTEREIHGLTHVWSEVRNPAAAWKCFVLARENGLPVPEIIESEIMRFAQAVSAPLADKAGSITQKSVAAAWGITKGRKPGLELRNALREFDLYSAYWDMRRTSHRKEGGRWVDIAGKSRGDAIAALSKKFTTSPKTIEGILDALFKKLGSGDPSKNQTFGEP